MINNFIEDQVERNLESKDRWGLYYSHRQKILEIIRSKSSSNSDKICILGAGNCNDLNLNILANQFKEVHLVDLDGQAIRNGISRQGLDYCSRLHVHGTVDLTNSLWFLSKFNQEIKPSESEVKQFIQESNFYLNLYTSESFDVVVSVCILTQLINTTIYSLGHNHPCLFDFILMTRNYHLKYLTNLLKPKGWGLLITDIVSSDSFAKMESIPEESFPNTVNQLIINQNFFHGVNPYKISAMLSSDPLLSKVRMLRPWRWSFGPRVYAVCAIEAQRVD
jgi:hypothetical protein